MAPTSTPPGLPRLPARAWRGDRPASAGPPATRAADRARGRRLPAAVVRGTYRRAPGHGASAALGAGLDRPGRRGGSRRPDDRRAAVAR